MSVIMSASQLMLTSLLYPCRTKPTITPIVLINGDDADNMINELVVPDGVDIQELLVNPDKISMQKKYECPSCDAVFPRLTTMQGKFLSKHVC